MPNKTTRRSPIEVVAFLGWLWFTESTTVLDSDRKKKDGFEKLPVTFSHAETAAALPFHHHDPFDRMLVAQARAGGLTLVTISALGRQLASEFGRGFSEKCLRHMIRFAEAFPDPKIVSALRRQLSWTHFKSLIYLDNSLKRDFYAEMCRIEGWNTRTLNKKIHEAGRWYINNEAGRW